MEELDDTDLAILHFLQTDARDITNTDIGEKIDVSTGTVGERIRKLRDSGVIVNCCIDIDYEAAGIPHYLLLTCTVPTADRDELAERALQKHGVVNVREILTGEENLQIEIVGETTDEITQTIQTLEETGIEIRSSELIKREHRRPFNGLGDPTIAD